MIKLCKTLPLTGPGGDQLLTPSLQLFLLLQQYIYISFDPLCVEYVCILLYRNMWPFMRCEKEKEKYLFNVHRRAGSTPCPPPLLRWQSCGGGGGEGWRTMFCLGILSREGGISGKWIQRVILAGGSGRFHGKTFLRVILADLFGGSFWHIYLAGFHK